MKKVILFLSMLLVIFPLLAVIHSDEGEVDEFLREILISDIPVTYGDENFRNRILERTGGERDPIGLVLTGGSARACAHIGVLRWLDEHGIVPDFIVTNSMGSIIGMLYAAGFTPDQIEYMLSDTDISTFFALTLPAHGGFLNTAGFRALIDYILGKDFRLEDTDIPVMVVCDDLVSKREIRITEGPFTDVLIGSFALPVYFNPLRYNGHLLVDGGVISLAPIDAAYEYSDTVVLSTTFYDPESMNLINPVTILNVSFDIGKRQNASSDLKKYKDLIWIRCAVEQFSFMAFKDSVEMAAIGYECTEELKDSLLSLSSGERVQDEERIAAMTDRIRETRNNLRYFGRLRSSSFSDMLSLDFLTLDDENRYLKNSFVTGFEYRILFDNFDLSMIAGVGNDTQNLAAISGFTTVGAHASYYPFSAVRFMVEGYMDMLRFGSGYKPQFYCREALDMYIMDTPELSVSFHQGLEYFRDNAETYGKGSVLSVLAKAEYMKNDMTVKGDLGYILTGDDIAFSEKRNYIQVTGEVGKDFAPFSTRLFARYRQSVDGKGSVPFFTSDGHTSDMVDYGARCLVTDSSSYNIFLRGNIDSSLGFDPTFGEFLILESPSMGLFASALLSKESWSVTAGCEMTSVFSLIGLIKFPTTLRLGYEFRPGWTGGFTASLAFTITN